MQNCKSFLQVNILSGTRHIGFSLGGCAPSICCQGIVETLKTSLQISPSTGEMTSVHCSHRSVTLMLSWMLMWMRNRSRGLVLFWLKLGDGLKDLPLLLEWTNCFYIPMLGSSAMKPYHLCLSGCVIIDCLSALCLSLLFPFFLICDFNLLICLIFFCLCETEM